MKMLRAVIMLAASAAVATSLWAQDAEAKQPPGTNASSPGSGFDQLVEQFFESYFRFNPTYGTAAGFHQYDTQLEDYSKGAIDAQIASARDFLARFEKLDPASLDAQQQSDRELVMSQLNGALLELEDIRMWEKDPDRYSSGITASAFVIMAREFAPPDVRLRSLIARERRMPAVFQAARANLKNPPRVFTEVAIDQLPGIVSFFQNEVPAAFQEVKDKKLLSEFIKTNQAVIASLRSYEKFLRGQLLPKSKGAFRIGTENYRKKLLYEEMVDTPLEDLLEVGYADLRKNQKWFEEVAEQIDSSKTPQQILNELESDHPAAGEMLEAVRGTLDDLRRFIQEKHIATIPSPVLPIVQETPPFMRALSTASMDTPGPYETTAKEAFFNVTLPGSEWPKERVESWLRGFFREALINLAVHEAYPGHYTQFLWVQHAPSKVRKLLGSGSNAEGWAHYSEQMMLDEGYGRTKPASDGKDLPYLKLRIAQLQDALLRNVRYICGIRMHTGDMTVEQCKQMFIKEGFQQEAVADQEAKRGTSDPTYLVYTLGKLAILKLREDYQKQRGERFNLQEFHDNLLKQGFPPIKLIRSAMLGEPGEVL